jgi:hypothetical protein
MSLWKSASFVDWDGLDLSCTRMTMIYPGQSSSVTQAALGRWSEGRCTKAGVQKLDSSRPKLGRMEEILEGGRGPSWAVAPLQSERERPFMFQDALKCVYYSSFHSLLRYGVNFGGNSSYSPHMFWLQKAESLQGQNQGIAVENCLSIWGSYHYCLSTYILSCFSLWTIRIFFILIQKYTALIPDKIIMFISLRII